MANERKNAALTQHGEANNTRQECQVFESNMVEQHGKVFTDAPDGSVSEKSITSHTPSATAFVTESAIQKFLQIFGYFPLTGLLIPITGWVVFTPLCLSGWFSDCRTAVIYYYWVPHMFCAAVFFVFTIAHAVFESGTKISMKGMGYTTRCALLYDVSGTYKPLLLLSLLREGIIGFELGWVFIGGVFYFFISNSLIKGI